MDFAEFTSSMTQSSPPEGLSPALQAMWFDGKGDWSAAHNLIQDLTTTDAAWIHAYLHRKEGDDGNAAYWYHRANQEFCHTSLPQEWKSITEFLLAQR